MFETIEEIEARANEIKDAMLAEDADLEALQAEAEQLVERKAQLEAEIAEKKEQRKADIRSIIEGAGEIIEKVEERKIMTNAEIRDSREYIDAFAEYIKSGKDKECRALLTENASEGGQVPVPTFVYDIVKNAWEREGIMRLVRKSYLKGNIKVSYEVSASDAVFHGEGNEAIDEEELVLGVATLIPDSIKKFITLSDELIDTRGEEFLRYIYDELTQKIAKKMADEIVDLIVTADTVADTTGNVGVPKINADPAVGTVAQAIAQLSDQAANPTIVMNKLTWGKFKEAQYANGFSVDPFEGLPVVFNNSLPSFDDASTETGTVYMIVGDFGEGFLANFPNGDGIDISVDNVSLALRTQDLVGILGREYVALGVIGPKAFCKVASVGE